MAADVVVFAKQPAPGRVKTRLAGALGAEGAAALYAAFVWDLCGRLAAEGAFRVTVAADPGPDNPFFAELSAKLGLAVRPQGEGDLGARMAGALRRHLEDGADFVLLIGTDLPTLPVAHLHAARRSLDGPARVLFGPTTDGGYYLVGASRAALPAWARIEERLFRHIPWGTDDVLHRTLARAADLPVALGPAWYDVDEAADLPPLLRHLRAGAAPDLPRTRATLAAWGRL